MSRWLPRLLIAVLGVGLVVLQLWAVVVVPPLLIDTSGIADPAKRLDEVSALRTTLASVPGGLAVAAGAIVAAFNFHETSRQNRAVLEFQRRGRDGRQPASLRRAKVLFAMSPQLLDGLR